MEAVAYILPVVLGIVVYLVIRARRSAPDITAEPLVARAPEPPTVQVRGRPAALPGIPALESTPRSLAALGVPNPLRHVLTAPSLDCEELRRTPSGGLWEARVMGGQRVVFELLGEAPGPGCARLQLAAFATDAEAWTSEPAYAASDDCVPLGTIVLHDELRDYGQDPRPLCVLAAPVTQVHADGDVQHALAVLRGGTLLVVGAPPTLRGEAVAGGVMAGTFWLCGRAVP